MKKKLIIVITVFILATLFYKISFAENLDELQQKRENLQNQINQSNEQVEGIQTQISDLLVQVNSINDKITTFEQELNEIETKLTDVQTKIDEVTIKLNNLQKNYAEQKRVLEQRLVALYEGGDIQYLDVLLNSSSIAEFISNYYLISEIASYDKDILDNIERQKNTITTLKETLNEKKSSIKAIKSSKEKTSIALENAKVIKNSYIKNLSEEELKIQTQIEKFNTELKNVEAEIIYLTTGNLDSTYVGGELAWPSPGYTTITSVFGMRFHPIFKINRMHSGLDIGVPIGGIIVAANDGIVIKSAYATGYGNMVMIDHGGGISTVYGHGSELVAQVGQTVKRGDIIMKAGSTGWSTGPHLHFEVRISGTCVDPLPYITKAEQIEQNTDNNNELM